MRVTGAGARDEVERRAREARDELKRRAFVFIGFVRRNVASCRARFPLCLFARVTALRALGTRR